MNRRASCTAEPAIERRIARTSGRRLWGTAGIALLILIAAPAAFAQTLAIHDYDPVSDAVVTWRIAPGRSAGQSFTVPSGSRISGFSLKLQRNGSPASLQFRLGTKPGAGDLASGRLGVEGISPWFEHWRDVRLPSPVTLSSPVTVARRGRVYLTLELPANSEGSYDLFGTAAEPLSRQEFRTNFRYEENWYAKRDTSTVFENPANLDYGFRTPRYPGGAAFDAQGEELTALDFAFEITGEKRPSRKCEERFAFIESITGPLYAQPLADPDARPSASEVALSGAWGASSTLRSEMVNLALVEFQEFLKTAMRARSGTGRGQLFVEVGCGSPPRKAEGFEVRVTPGEVRICGTDERGAMRGLHHIEAQMRLRRAPFLSTGTVRKAPLHSPRITGAPFYSRMELDAPVHQYTDGLLGRIARAGFNAIWVWGDLDEVAHSSVYPELDRGVAERQQRLTGLAERAARYGIDVYVQLASKPLTEEFYQRHPDVRGSEMPAYGGVNILCTSVTEAREHLRAAAQNLMASVPRLKGFVYIVGGEGFMHCWMRKNTCPRCSLRKPQETIGEFSRSLLEGARAANPSAAVVLWPYSASNTWSKDDITQSGLIERLPAGITLMSEFDKEGDIRFGGATIPAYDYAISIPGPANRFLKQADLARERGLGMWAKTEHAIALEFVQTPYIPVFFQWAERFRGIRAVENVTGVFANWMHYGFTPSRAADVFYASMWDTLPDAGDILGGIARRDFGDRAAPHVLRAWQAFSRGIRQYPFSGPMAMGPVQKGPSHPLLFDKSLQPKHGVGRQFKNDLSWTRPWGPELTIRQFEAMEREWAEGVAELGRAALAAESHAAEAHAELGVARALLSCIRSTVNVARWIQLRDTLWEAKDKAVMRTTLARMTEVAQSEVRNAREALPVVCADSRLGYANSARSDQTGVPRAGIYSPGSIEKKIAQVERVLRVEIPQWKREHGIGE